MRVHKEILNRTSVLMHISSDKTIKFAFIVIRMLHVLHIFSSKVPLVWLLDTSNIVQICIQRDLAFAVILVGY